MGFDAMPILEMISSGKKVRPSPIAPKNTVLEIIIIFVFISLKISDKDLIIY
jgi:hypothetical protein